jgi:peptidoglycan/LPS O-acetylase OafA/YrhL
MTETIQKLDNNRYYGLDILRALATLGVLLLHFTHRIYEFYPNALPVSVDTSFPHVDLPVYSMFFFSLSGFVVLMSFKRYSWYEFLIMRFIRLYPIFVFGCFAAYFIICISPLMQNGIDIFGFIANLTMVANWFGYRYVDQAYWTLAYEIGFYGFMILSTILFGKKIFKYIPIMLTISAIIFILMIEFIQITDVAPLHHFLMMTEYTEFFALGTAVYMIRMTGEKYNIVYVFPIIASYFIAYYYDGFVGSVIIFVSMILLLMASYIKIPYNKMSKPFIELSKISYPLYIFHQMIGITIIAHLEHLGVSADLSTMITIIFMIILAYYVTYYFDIPVGKTIKQKLLP